MPRKILLRIVDFFRNGTSETLSYDSDKGLVSVVKPPPEVGKYLMEALCQHRLNGGSVKFVLAEPKKYFRTSVSWLVSFLKAHPELKITSLPISRHGVISIDVLGKYFSRLEHLRDKYNYKPWNIYNMDESSFAEGKVPNSKGNVIVLDVLPDDDNPVMKHMERTSFLNVIECISTDGTIMDPLLIFKAYKVAARWTKGVRGIQGWTFKADTFGRVSNKLAMQWLSDQFIPFSSNRAKGERVLLILNGDGSHITSDFVVLCYYSNIDIVVLPPHTSHVLQPLDVTVFSSLKHELSQIVKDERIPWSDTRRKETSMGRWVQRYVQARSTISSQDVIKGFEKTGIWPFNPQPLLDKYTLDDGSTEERSDLHQEKRRRLIGQ